MLTDCEKCWETPCKCGYDYKQRYGSPEAMANFIIGILGYRSNEELLEILQILNERIPEKINNSGLEAENQSGRLK